jgi:hypothetical protein
MQVQQTVQIMMAGFASLIVMQGCDSTIVSLGGSYDLADYLFPGQSGTLLYKLHTAQKEKGESSFTKPEYKEDVQYSVLYDGTKVTLTNRADDHRSNIYVLESNRIAVEEKEENLTYHLDRTASTNTNQVQETTIKQWSERNGDVQITYDCNVTKHLESMTVDPDPKTYTDILKMECLKQRTIYAKVGNKKFETVIEMNEENFYAKDQGMIQSTVTECEYTRVDDVQTSEDGCTREIYKIWAFLAD